MTKEEVDKLNEQGVELINEQRYEEAIECFDRVLAIEPKHTNALTNKGFIINDLKKYKEAIEYFDRALVIDPKHKTALNNKGYALNELERYEEAIEYFDNLLAIDPTYKTALNGKGGTLYELKRYEEAIECFDKTLAVDSEFKYALNGKGNALYELKKYEEAIECFDKTLAVDPNYKNALNGKGNALYQLERYEEAIECFDKTLAVDPNYKNALNGKGFALFELKEYAEAAHCFGQAKTPILQVLTGFPPIKDDEKALEELLKGDDYFSNLTKLVEPKIRKAYGDIYLQSLLTVALLHVDGKNEEKDVAHYTSKKVAQAMLFKNNPSNLASPLRLSSIARVNDPTESETLFKFCGLGEENADKNSQYQAFISCFTFDQDCLNQFRLYGKENEKEATGMSLILDMNYFNSKPNIAMPLTISGEKEQSRTKGKGDADRYSLFRCIYIDPITNQVISLGRREEYTFYREDDISSNSTTAKIDKTEKRIKRYKRAYNKTLVEVKKSIKTLRSLINDNKSLLDDEIIRQLLIHLRYLVKDVAFMEERECRIVAIEKLHNNDRIKHDPHSDKLYIEGPTIGKRHLKKVYFAPKAKDVRHFKDRLAHEGFPLDVKCQLSKHPYELT